jgi:hypothetical protein
MSRLVIGYGTLLLKASLSTSVGQRSAHGKSYVPVIVPGFRRLFNLRPEHYRSTAKLSTGGIECAALNVEPDPGCYLNAVAFEVSDEELEALDKRERNYSRITVQMLSFDDGQAFGQGDIYSAPLDSPFLIRDLSRLLPSWRDVVWARLGACQLGEKFGEDFDRTTYLGDGSTRMIDVYRPYLADVSDVEIPVA